MRFEYDITTFPAETGGYNLTAYTEGVLRLLVGTATFLDASGILLVEFAVVLHKWLRTLEAGPTDFYYASMDFEEEPVLAFRYEADTDAFRLESVWAQADVGAVRREDVVSAAQKYLSRFRVELRDKHGVDLGAKLKEAVMDG